MTPSDAPPEWGASNGAPAPGHPPPAPPSAIGDAAHDGVTLGPRRLHPASPALDVVPYAQQFIPPFVILAISVGRWAVLAMTVLAALMIAWRALAWSRHSYRIENGVLRIEEGVLRHDTREIPLARIQQVDLRRQLRHRVLGVVAVRIDTAGGGSGAEAVLDAMSDRDALELRSALLERRGAPAAVPQQPPPPPGAAGWHPDGAPPPPPDSNQAPQGHVGEVVAQLTTRDLAIAGVTGSGLLAGLSILGFAFLVLDWLPESTSEDISNRALDVVGTAAVFGALLVVVIPLWLAVAAGSSILRDHEFTLVRFGTDLHLRRGLLDQREATLALHRIQAVWILDNPLRRRLGLVSVQLQSAGSGSEASSDVSRVTVPIFRRSDLAALLAMVMPGVAEPELVPAPPAALRRARVRAVAAALLATLGFTAIFRTGWTALALALVVPALYYAQHYYRALGHALTDVVLVSRWGAALRRTAIVPVAKTQSGLLRSTPFQRRVDLATLRVQVAGRGHTVEIVDGDTRTLTQVRDRVLVAPGARQDEVAVRRRTQAGLEAEDTPLTTRTD